MTTQESLVASMNPAEMIQALITDFVERGDKKQTLYELLGKANDGLLFPLKATHVALIESWEELHELYMLDEIYYLWRIEHPVEPKYVIVF